MTLGQQILAFEDFSMSLPRINHVADTTNCISEAGDIIGNYILLVCQLENGFRFSSTFSENWSTGAS